MAIQISIAHIQYLTRLVVVTFYLQQIRAGQPEWMSVCLLCISSIYAYNGREAWDLRGYFDVALPYTLQQGYNSAMMIVVPRLLWPDESWRKGIAKQTKILYLEESIKFPLYPAKSMSVTHLFQSRPQKTMLFPCIIIYHRASFHLQLELGLLVD